MRLGKHGYGFGPICISKYAVSSLTAIDAILTSRTKFEESKTYQLQLLNQIVLDRHSILLRRYPLSIFPTLMKFLAVYEKNQCIFIFEGIIMKKRD